MSNPNFHGDAFVERLAALKKALQQAAQRVDCKHWRTSKTPKPIPNDTQSWRFSPKIPKQIPTQIPKVGASPVPTRLCRIR